MSKSKKKLQAAARTALGLPQPASTAPLATAAETAASTTATEAAPKKARTLRPAGLGYPNAKKLVNPQHTLEAKKEAAKKIGGSMVWQAKFWVVKVPKGEFNIPSREMAALSVATFLEKVSQPPPKAPVADPTPAADQAPAAAVAEVRENELIEESASV